MSNILVLDNLFTNEEIVYLNEEIERQYINRRPMIDKNTYSEHPEESLRYRIDPTMGRALFVNFNIPETIILKLNEKINKEFPNIKYENTIFCEYSEKYGTPSLKEHIDNDKSLVCLDYRLSSDIDWDLVIDDKRYLTEDNSGVAFYSGRHTHKRPDVKFNFEQYCKMFFFFFKEQIVE